MDEIKVENTEVVDEAPKTEAELAREAEEAEKARKAKLKAIWDKFTTGLLILLMIAPLLVLGYIFWWFTAGGF